MDVFKALRALGLGEKEATIYLALVEGGTKTVGRLALATGIHRRSCYDALGALQEKGLVSHAVKDGSKAFMASDPKALLALVREKEQMVELLLPQLRKKKKPAKGPVVEVFTGLKGVKSVFEGLLQDGGPIRIYGGQNPARTSLKYYYPKFTKMREKLGVKVRAIHSDTPELRNYTKGLPLWQAKYIEEKSTSPAFWWVQSSTVFLVFWKQEPMVIRVKDKDLARTYLKSFNALWKAAKR